MSEYLFNRSLIEHEHLLPPENTDIRLLKEIYFQDDENKKCIEIKNNEIYTLYYIGLGWISDNKAVYVAPKLNTFVNRNQKDTDSIKETDFLKMLFQCLQYNYYEISNELVELFEVKWDQPTIEIEQKNDLLTPLLVIQFLSLVKIIVRKGLKKSYYRVERNLKSKVKGRVLVAKTLKENIFKNKNLNTFCAYDEFGLDGLENRLLKRTLSFISTYLTVYKTINTNDIQNIFSYLLPAFENVSEDVELNELRYTKTNPFYNEYEEAIRLARIILRRYGYNISNIEKRTILVNPFWIDMSKLFELYVLGLLKDKFSNQVIYHKEYRKKELDYLLLSPPMVIDAKYKPQYESTTLLDDIRQLSGYARLKAVYRSLKLSEDKVIDCVIIYPDQENGYENLTELSFDGELDSINEYVGFYKIAVKLPTIK